MKTQLASAPLAIHGGPPTITAPFRPYSSIGEAEVAAVAQVARSGCLSGFYGSWGEEFFGGPVVREFESAWSRHYGVKHTVSVNSATSGLFAAIGAAGISPGDEVIVPPYTMSATAMAPLVYGAIPVFADIEADTFCIDPAAVERAITPRTRAIFAVNLFGHPARLTELLDIARRHNLILIEDNAQGPLAREADRFAGTVGHIGVFSLNYHKHIHTGEGGMCVTNDDELARRLQMIRNHAENVVEALEVENLTNLIGFNYRMTELSAAVGLEQLKNIEAHVQKRERIGQYLTDALRDLEGLTVPQTRAACRHVYYVWALRYDADVIGVPRSVFSAALAAEGVPHGTGYVRPLYRLPVFQKRQAFGRDGYPFSLTDRRYDAIECPVVERMHNSELITLEPCAYDLGAPELELLVAAFKKVHARRADLRTA